MNRKIAVVFVTSAAYVPLTAVACESLLNNAIDPQRVELYILFDSLEESLAAKLHEGIRRKGGSLAYISLETALEQNPVFHSLSPHYYRLLAPSVLPNQVDRYIYLDSDIIVRGDLGTLWGYDLQQNTIAAVQDYIKTVREAISNYQVLNIDGTRKYYNSGMLLVDRTRWLGNNVSNRILACTMKNRAHLDSMGLYHQYDQYGLNVILHDQCLELDNTWNYGSMDPYKNARIVHYIGNGKPWDQGCIDRYRSEFYVYLESAGWNTSDLPISP